MPNAPFSPRTSTILLGVTGVVESALISSPGNLPWDAWGKFEARRSRYALLWAFFSQNIYSQAHRWADQVKDALELYDETRSVFAPANAIGKFWPEHIYPGALDAEAGDGSAVPSAAPVVTDRPEVRAMIARLWRDSNWATENVKRTLLGTVLGDVAMSVDHDAARGRCYLRVVHPGDVRDYDTDAAGNCRGYVIERDLPDPRAEAREAFPDQYVVYREECERRGESVVYRTYLDGDPHDWRDYRYAPANAPRVGDTWSMPYGFVPFVFTQNQDMGQRFGWGVFQPTLSKILETDGVGSAVADQIYTLRDAPIYFEGTNATELALPKPADADGGKQTRRPMMGGEGKPHVLTGAMNVDHATSFLKALGASLERDHPELAVDAVGPNSSGESRREARRKVESRVIAARSVYDDALVRLHKMAMSIATGAYGDGDAEPCVGYAKMPPTAYLDGAFDHAIGNRPVFTLDAQAKLEEEEQRGKALKSLTDAGVPLGTAMRRAGFPASDVAAALRELADERADAVRRSVAVGFGDAPRDGPQDQGTDGGGEP